MSIQHTRRTSQQMKFPLRLVLFVLWWIIVSLAVWQLKLFRILQITCTHDQQFCSQSTLAELDRLKGKWMLDPKLELAQLKIQQFEPDTDQVVFTKKFPHELDVTIQKVKTQLQISCQQEPTGSAQQLLKVAINGNVKTTASMDPAIPQISASTGFCERLLAAGFTQQELIYLQQLDTAFALTPQQLFWENESTLLLFLTSNQRLIIDPQHIESNLQKYQLVKGVLQPNWTEIDLRFEDVVVRGPEAAPSP